MFTYIFITIERIQHASSAPESNSTAFTTSGLRQFYTSICLCSRSLNGPWWRKWEQWS